MSATDARRPMLLMAPQTGRHASATEREVASRMARLASTVRARGHDVRFLCARQPRALLGRSAGIARLVEEQEPASIVWVDVRSDRDAYYLLWPRDGFQDWMPFVAVSAEPSMHAVATTLGLSPVESALCEGGLFVRCGDRVLVSSALDHEAIAGLPSRCRHATIPYPFASDLYRREQPSDIELTHIDLDSCLVQGAVDSVWWLVGERYHRAYRAHVDRTVERLGLQLFVAPQREVVRQGLNIVALSSRAVVVPDGCPRIRSFLSDLLGADSVIEVHIDETFDYNGGRGGLACMSTLVYER